MKAAQQCSLRHELVAFKHLGIHGSKMIVGANRNEASMGNITLSIFQLDGSVLNVKRFRQYQFDGTKNHVTLRKGDVIDANMAGQRVRV